MILAPSPPRHSQRFEETCRGAALGSDHLQDCACNLIRVRLGSKGETLKAYVEQHKEGAAWLNTWSCWQQSRQVSVNGKKRQCGICAACMLRRLSVHAAELAEPADTYVWEDLRAQEFEEGAAEGFDKIARAQHEYAIAGTLHLDHLAGLTSFKSQASALSLSAFRLSQALGTDEATVAGKLRGLLTRHANEWHSFVESLGSRSFVTHWTAAS